MQLTMTARHCELSEAQKEHATQEINRLSRYSDHILSADLIVTREKYRFTSELVVHVEGVMLASKEEDTEMYAALDQAIQKMTRQLKKHNGKLHDHRVKKQV